MTILEERIGRAEARRGKTNRLRYHTEGALLRPSKEVEVNPFPTHECTMDRELPAGNSTRTALMGWNLLGHWWRARKVTDTPRRRQFGLRSVLGMVAVFAAIIALLNAWFVAPYQAEQHAATALTLNLIDTKVTPTGVARLKALWRLSGPLTIWTGTRKKAGAAPKTVPPQGSSGSAAKAR